MVDQSAPRPELAGTPERTSHVCCSPGTSPAGSGSACAAPAGVARWSKFPSSSARAQGRAFATTVSAYEPFSEARRTPDQGEPRDHQLRGPGGEERPGGRRKPAPENRPVAARVSPPAASASRSLRTGGKFARTGRLDRGYASSPLRVCSACGLESRLCGRFPECAAVGLIG
jgi:hypothetical protein